MGVCRLRLSEVQLTHFLQLGDNDAPWQLLGWQRVAPSWPEAGGHIRDGVTDAVIEAGVSLGALANSNIMTL